MKLEGLKKAAIIELCNAKGIDYQGKSKRNLLDAIYQHEIDSIESAKEDGFDHELLKSKLTTLAEEYRDRLDQKITDRRAEMKEDDNSHYLVYRVLGISNVRGKLIDEYQNVGRFLYNYAGSFLEEAATLCFAFKNPKGKKTLVENTIGKKPKTFEIDFLDGSDAVEIKWRDATTDGDHITKEHTRVQVIRSHNYRPIRVMFYYPQREQAIRVQETLKTVYAGVNGLYYSEQDAWNYITENTGYNLLVMLTEIADTRTFDDE